MVNCCAVCKSKSDKRPELMFHGFPKDEALRRKWLQNMGIRRQVGKSATICSIHFSEDCFKPAIVSGRPILKRGSIPTILTEEELMKQVSISDETSSDSLNMKHETRNSDNKNVLLRDSQSHFEDMIKQDHIEISNQEEEISYEAESSEFENLETFENSDPLERETEANQKMLEELQYSCRQIKVKGVKWEKFCKFPESLQQMYWMEAQHLIKEQSRNLKSLHQKNQRYKTKIENLNAFTQSMKREIAKRNHHFKIKSLDFK